MVYRKGHIETTLTFRLSKLRWKKHVQTVSIFHPSKYHRKSTSKRRGNSSIFCFRRIDIELMLISRVVSVGTRTRCEACSKLTTKTLERRHLHCSCVFIVNLEHYFTPCPTVSIANFEYVIAGWNIVTSESLPKIV